MTTTKTKTIHTKGRPVWAEISLKAILKNLQVIREHIGPKPRILAVVKSNAYGLGAVPSLEGACRKPASNGSASLAPTKESSCASRASENAFWFSPVFGPAKRSASSKII